MANLGLLSDYSRSMTSLAEWCQWVKDDLSAGTPSLLPAADALPDDAARKFARWAEMKDTFQEYYNVVRARGAARHAMGTFTELPVWHAFRSTSLTCASRSFLVCPLPRGKL